MNIYKNMTFKALSTEARQLHLRAQIYGKTYDRMQLSTWSPTWNAVEEKTTKHVCFTAHKATFDQVGKIYNAVKNPTEDFLRTYEFKQRTK